MRFLLISNFLSHRKGSRGVIEELSVLLKKKGHSIITCSSHKSPLPKIVDIVKTVIGFRKEYDLAIVDVFSGNAFIWCEIACNTLLWLKKPFILTLRGGNLPDFTQKNSYRVSRLLKTAAAVVTPSLYLQKSLSSFCENILFIPNGLDLSLYQNNFQAPPKNIIWLRAFHRKLYNPLMAVDTFIRLSSFYTGIHLTMIGPDKGDGSYQEIENYISQNGLEKRVTLLKGIEKKQVPDLLNTGQIFLNTTRFESFGVSVMEAAACGLCIVTTNVGELPYLWKDGEDALLVLPDDPQAMAAAVERILTEPGLAARLSANARSKAEKYDWPEVLPKWEELFGKICP